MNTPILTRNAASDTLNKSNTFASRAFALLILATSLAAAPAFADSAPKSKTTGSHISRDAKTADDTKLEPVEVMLGAVRDARSAAREARDEPSRLADLPQLDDSAFLDAPSQPPR